MDTVADVYDFAADRVLGPNLVAPVTEVLAIAVGNVAIIAMRDEFAVRLFDPV